MEPSRWRVLWHRGGSAEPGLFGPYLKLALGDNRLYVLDRGKQSITAVNRQTGRDVWEYRERDPFASMMAFAPTHNGQLTVAYANPSTLKVVSSGGELLSSTAIAAKPFHSICESSPDTLLAVAPHDATPFVVISRDSVVDQRAMPWEDQRRLPFMETQGHVISINAATGCVFYQVIGNRFAVWHGSKFIAWGAYPMTGLFRRRETKSGTALAAAADARKIAIVFSAGSSRASQTIVDFYSTRTGTYERSVYLPFPAIALTGHSDQYFIVHRQKTHTAITALRLMPAGPE